MNSNPPTRAKKGKKRKKRGLSNGESLLQEERCGMQIPRGRIVSERQFLRASGRGGKRGLAPKPEGWLPQFDPEDGLKTTRSRFPRGEGGGGEKKKSKRTHPQKKKKS